MTMLFIIPLMLIAGALLRIAANMGNLQGPPGPMGPMGVMGEPGRDAVMDVPTARRRLLDLVAERRDSE